LRNVDEVLSQGITRFGRELELTIRVYCATASLAFFSDDALEEDGPAARDTLGSNLKLAFSPLVGKQDFPFAHFTRLFLKQT
jgi:hypothetical protein